MRKGSNDSTGIIHILNMIRRFFNLVGHFRLPTDKLDVDDINISMQSLATAGASVMDTVTVDSNKFRAFVGTGATAQQADGSLEILHAYSEGTNIEPHVHIMPSANGAGNMKLYLGYRWWNKETVMPAETVLSVVVTGPFTAYTETRASFGNITGTGKTYGGRFVFRIWRDPADAADTYTGHAIALDFGLHIWKDGLGSRLVSSKN